MSGAALPDDVAREIASPASYAEWDGLHRTLARVRRELPFARAELPEYRPLELAGAPRRTVTNFVGGPKSLPIRFRLRA